LNFITQSPTQFLVATYEEMPRVVKVSASQYRRQGLIMF
jgi:hypothetical protein